MGHPAVSALPSISWTRRRRRASCALLGLFLGAVAGVRLADQRAPACAATGHRARGPPVVPARREPPCSACCAPARWSSTSDDAVLQASAPAYTLGLVRGDRAARRTSCRPRARSTPRRRDPPGRAGDRRAAGRPAVPRLRPGGAAEQPAGPGAHRGPHPRAPGRGDPARLRRQRLPRAQDAGRCATLLAEAVAGGRRRPGGGAALRRRGCRPRPTRLNQPGPADHRAVAGSRATTPWTQPLPVDVDDVSSSAPIDHQRDRGQGQGHRGRARRRARPRGPRQRRPDRPGAGNLVANAVAYSPDAQPGRRRGDPATS